MQDIETFAMEGLEGKAIGLSQEQTDFELYSKISLISVAALMFFHQVMKLKRFKATNWTPLLNSNEYMTSFTKASCDVIERDAAPVLMVLVFTVSSGALHLVGMLIFFVIILVMMYLICGYSRESFPNIIAGRILLYLATLILFVSLLGNDHIFLDSTLP